LPLPLAAGVTAGAGIGGAEGTGAGGGGAGAVGPLEACNALATSGLSCENMFSMESLDKQMGTGKVTVWKKITPGFLCLQGPHPLLETQPTSPI